ncbi:30S ribosomal protein S11 [bacterium]|nr:30S ribosomal protein S11 [bacterium]
MSDKNGKTEEKKIEKKVDEKSADIKVEKKENVETRGGASSSASVKKDDRSKASEKISDAGQIKGLEELPEDIRKKLEKKKAGKEQKSKKTKVRKKKKTSRNVSVGKAYIKATYNNTIVTLTDLQGDVIAWGSAGMAGFRGPKKSTPYAAQIITRLAVGKAREEYGLKEVSVFIKGVGTGREAAVRALNSNGLNVTLIKDVTPMPHNGCRARRPRRV